MGLLIRIVRWQTPLARNLTVRMARSLRMIGFLPWTSHLLASNYDPFERMTFTTSEQLDIMAHPDSTQRWTTDHTESPPSEVGQAIQATATLPCRCAQRGVRSCPQPCLPTGHQTSLGQSPMMLTLEADSLRALHLSGRHETHAILPMLPCLWSYFRGAEGGDHCLKNLFVVLEDGKC